jgi:hypothetical protein
MVWQSDGYYTLRRTVVKRMRATHSTGVALGLTMEMAGIEPASEEFDRRHPTSLVGFLILRRRTSTDRVDDAPADPSVKRA